MLQKKTMYMIGGGVVLAGLGYYYYKKSAPAAPAQASTAKTLATPGGPITLSVPGGAGALSWYVCQPDGLCRVLPEGIANFTQRLGAYATPGGAAAGTGTNYPMTAGGAGTNGQSLFMSLMSHPSGFFVDMSVMDAMSSGQTPSSFTIYEIPVAEVEANKGSGKYNKLVFIGGPVA